MYLEMPIYMVCIVLAAFLDRVISEDVRAFVPEQIHVAFGNYSDSMVVMWATGLEISCHVTYWQATSEIKQNVDGKSVSVMEAVTYSYRAELMNLTADTVYFYFVVCEHEGTHTRSERYRFHTPNDGANFSPHFLVYGDFGLSEGNGSFPRLEMEVESEEYDAILHVGDIAYNMHNNGGQVGNEFMNKLQKIAANIPYMMSPGNHEIHDNFHQYRTRFSTPNTDWPIPMDKMWYSYDIGPVHIISYSTEVYFTSNQYYVCQQYYWLLRDLQRANENRHLRPWIIAVGHRPMYCSGTAVEDCTGKVIAWVKHGLETLFYTQGVDLIIQAHEHSYERMWPIYQDHIMSRDYVNPQAPVHIISGGVGCSEGQDGDVYQSSMTAFRISEKGHNSYGHLRVVNSTHLYVDQVFSANGSVIDSIWITQTRHGPFMPHVVCNSTSANHVSCVCPPIFPYITIGCVLAFVFIVFIAVCVVLCNKYVIPKCHASSAHTITDSDIKLLTSVDSDSDDILLS